MLVLIGLFLAGSVAGTVDAVAGGGGLLTVPSLFMTDLAPFPQLVLGTNKGQGVFGTATSLSRFWMSSLLDRRRAAISFGPALVGAALGVWTMTRLSAAVLTPLVMVLLGVVALFMLFQKTSSEPVAARAQPAVLAAVVAFALAFYDGFFGPGTGTFLILAYAWLWRDSLDSASANAKVVNFASNLASMITFAWLGRIVWTYALAMGMGQVVGGFVGAHLTIRVGRPLVRWVVVGVCFALLFRLAWQLGAH